jgi:O-acetyl-ADP-ribose deacetylase (regulator of RNase III)
MKKLEVDGVTFELVQGDITNQPDCEAIVNAANAELRTGGGVAGAIHRAAGPELERAGRPLAPIKPGEAVTTEGFKLPNDYVIHCLGPVYGRDKPEDRLLADCYRNALAEAEANEIECIAFPAISTGAFGYPVRDAADVAIATILAEIPNLNSVTKIRMVLWGDDMMNIHEDKLEHLGTRTG